MKNNKLPFKLETVTISQETYLELCEKIKAQDKLKERVDNVIDILRENNININSKKDIYLEDVNKAYTMPNEQGGITITLD